MKTGLIALAVLLLPVVLNAQEAGSARKPEVKTEKKAERVLSSEDHLEKKPAKKCAHGEELLEDGACQRINERIRPMRPDRP